MELFTLIFSIIVISLSMHNAVMASCPISHVIAHEGGEGASTPCEQSATCYHTAKFWCLSGGPSNNNNSS